MHREYITQTEQHISDAEDNGLISRGSTLENTVKALSNKVEDLEWRSRRKNIRLVDLSEKAEGQDMVVFLEKWITDSLGMES